jgi:CDP-diacylglycerol---glycerol-3-phosphate 3-phosphatidyltransferase
MNFFESEPIPEQWKTAYAKAIHPLIRLLNRLEVNPNTFTTLGLLISIPAACFMAVGHFRLGAVLTLLSGMCDTIDGKLARDSGKVTKFGALFDSTLDRYAEVVIFFGMAYYFIGNDMVKTSIAVAVALGGSLMVSYIRARAESLGFECKVGILQRPERLLLICIGGLIHPVALIVAVSIIAVFSNLTAFLRILHVWRQDRKNNTASLSS